MIDHVKKFGATEMDRALEMMLDTTTGEVSGEEKAKCQKLRDRLGDWMVEMGPDLGIARKGNEIHFSLPERTQLEEV